MGIGCAPPPPDAGGAGAGCVPPPDGAAVGCAAAGVGCGARVGAAPDEPPDGAVGCAVGCAPLCPMNGRLPQPLSRRAPIIRTVDGKSRDLNGTSPGMIIRFLNNRCGAFHRHHAKERWSKEESSIGSSVMSVCCNNGEGSLAWHTDVLRFSTRADPWTAGAESSGTRKGGTQANSRRF